MAINIDNNSGTIFTSDDNIITIGKKGAIQLGTGEYLSSENDESLHDFKGAIRYNEEHQCLQVCNGDSWKDINGQYKNTSHIAWSLLF